MADTLNGGQIAILVGVALLALIGAFMVIDGYEAKKYYQNIGQDICAEVEGVYGDYTADSIQCVLPDRSTKSLALKDEEKYVYTLRRLIDR